MKPIGIKAINPKDLQGAKKIPYHLWPDTATIVGVFKMLEGGLKYGRSNYRGKRIKASVYFDAIRRHATDWFEGRIPDNDEALFDCLGGVLASAAILVDANVAGSLIDDRAYLNKGYGKLIEDFERRIPGLVAKFYNPKVHHYSRLDNKLGKKGKRSRKS